MLRITLVSYLNTQTFIQGLKKEFDASEIEIHPVIPSQCARDLRDGKCDIALIPAGSLDDFPELVIEKDFCIGANGDVNSVFLLSQSPVNKLDTVLMDPHSRTSNGLARILMQGWWNHTVIWKEPQSRNFDAIQGKTAAVVIGDAAYGLKDRFKYVYDLSGEWKKWTGLPFVFAVWASFSKNLNEETRMRLNKAFQAGWHDRLETGRLKGPEFGYSPEGGAHYLAHSIDYLFDWPKHKSFVKYLKLLKAVPTVELKA